MNEEDLIYQYLSGASTLTYGSTQFFFFTINFSSANYDFYLTNVYTELQMG